MSEQNQAFKKPFARKFGLILASLFLLAGLFVAYNYWSGNIDGTWMVEDYAFFVKEEDKWVTKKENETSMKEKGLTYESYSFRKIVSGRIKDYGYYKFETDPYVVDFDYYLPEMRQVNQLSHKIELSVSEGNYDKSVEKALEIYYKNKADSTWIESERDNLNEAKHFSQSFRREGDRLHITIYDKDGKKINTFTYRLLSKEEADKEMAKFDKIRKDFEKRAGIKSKN